jgi:hypothetical protein
LAVPEYGFDTPVVTFNVQLPRAPLNVTTPARGLMSPTPPSETRAVLPAPSFKNRVGTAYPDFAIPAMATTATAKTNIFSNFLILFLLSIITRAGFISYTHGSL